MADTTTPNIKITNQVEGGNNNTWGTIADANFERIDNKFGDTTSIVTTGGDITLTENQEIVAAFAISGDLVSNSNIIFSGRGGVWILENTTTGNYTVTAKVSGQTGVVIPKNTKRIVWCNGTDIRAGYTEESVVAQVTIASAATTDILGAGSEFIAITGAATITSFGTGPNSKRFVQASGGFKITHNPATLVCPGGQDIKAVSGDTFVVISDGNSNCRIYAYTRSSHPPPQTPIGMIVDFAGDVTPQGWLFCYGQEVLRQEYPALFSVIGVIYGAGNTTTTFNLPNCQGRVRAGKDDMGGTAAGRLSTVLAGSTLGAAGGSETHTLTSAQIPAHNHAFSGTTSMIGDHVHSNRAPGPNGQHPTGTGRTDPTYSVTEDTGPAGSHDHTFSGTTDNNTGGGGAHSNVQPTIVFNTIIFAGV